MLGEPRVKGSHESHDFYGLLSNWNMTDVACERRRISGRHFSPTERTWRRRLHGKSEKYAFIMIYLKPQLNALNYHYFFGGGSISAFIIKIYSLSTQKIHVLLFVICTSSIIHLVRPPKICIFTRISNTLA